MYLYQKQLSASNTKGIVPAVSHGTKAHIWESQDVIKKKRGRCKVASLGILSLPVKSKFIASDTESAPSAKSRIIRSNSSMKNKKSRI